MTLKIKMTLLCRDTSKKIPPTHPNLFEGFEISVLHFVHSPANSKSGQIERD